MPHRSQFILEVHELKGAGTVRIESMENTNEEDDNSSQTSDIDRHPIYSKQTVNRYLAVNILPKFKNKILYKYSSFLYENIGVIMKKI